MAQPYNMALVSQSHAKVLGSFDDGHFSRKKRFVGHEGLTCSLQMVANVASPFLTWTQITGHPTIFVCISDPSR